MARPDGDRAAIWYGRLMRMALPFGVLALAANLFEAYQLLLIWQGMQYRRQRPG